MRRWGIVVLLTALAAGVPFTFAAVEPAAYHVDELYRNTKQHARVLIDGNVLYTDEDDTTIVALDVTNPAAPAPLARISIPTTQEASIAGIIDHQLIVDGGDPGVFLVDIRNTTQPVVLAPWFSGGLAGISNVAVVGTHLYAKFDYTPELAVVDITKQGAAAIVARRSGGGDGVQVVGTTVYATGGVNSDMLEILDARNPGAPVLLSSYTLPGYASDLVVEGTLAYVGYGSRTSGGVAIIDVTDPRKPVLRGSLRLSGAVSSLHVAKSLLYIYAELDGFVIADVRNPTAPAIVARQPINPAALFHRSIAVVDDLIYAAAGQLGIYHVRSDETLTYRVLLPLIRG